MTAMERVFKDRRFRPGYCTGLAAARPDRSSPDRSDFQERREEAEDMTALLAWPVPLGRWINKEQLPTITIRS